MTEDGCASHFLPDRLVSHSVKHGCPDPFPDPGLSITIVYPYLCRPTLLYSRLPPQTNYPSKRRALVVVKHQRVFSSC